MCLYIGLFEVLESAFSIGYLRECCFISHVCEIPSADRQPDDK